MTLEAKLEALLFASGDPVEVDDLIRVLESTALEVGQAVDRLKEKYNSESGVRLLQFGTHLQFATNPEAAGMIEDLLYPVQKKIFSRAALEILSIVAYKQPVTRGEIEDIRGVQCSMTVTNLINLGMIEEVGRKDTLGRPALFGTTDQFLRKFGLESLDDLPARDLSLLLPQEDGEIQ